jgi:arginine utilization protein RocB
MENNEYFNLPDLIELSKFGGDFHKYLEAVYMGASSRILLKNVLYLEE